MKTLKNSIIIKAIIITAIFMIVPMMVTAMGNSENAGGTNLDEKLIILADRLGEDEITIEEAQDLLEELRLEYQLEENKNLQAMKGFLEAVNTGDMTTEQVREQVRAQVRDQDATSEDKLPEQGKDNDSAPGLMKMPTPLIILVKLFLKQINLRRQAREFN